MRGGESAEDSSGIARYFKVVRDLDPLALKCQRAQNLPPLDQRQTRRHPQTVEANDFLLRGHAGNVAARLGQNGFGDTCLTLMAKEKVAVASMCVQDEEGFGLDLHSLKSESRARLTPGF